MPGAASDRALTAGAAKIGEAKKAATITANESVT
jgi:hypothetical protein